MTNATPNMRCDVWVSNASSARGRASHTGAEYTAGACGATSHRCRVHGWSWCHVGYGWRGAKYSTTGAGAVVTSGAGVAYDTAGTAAMHSTTGAGAGYTAGAGAT